MTRRSFYKTITAAAAIAPRLSASTDVHFSLDFRREAPRPSRDPDEWIFEAVIAPRVPEFLVIRPTPGGSLTLASTSPHTVYELRTLTQEVSLAAFLRHGIQPLFHGARHYLFGFASLEARAKAWDQFAADPHAPRGLSYQVSFYCLIPPRERS